MRTLKTPRELAEARSNEVGRQANVVCDAILLELQTYWIPTERYQFEFDKLPSDVVAEVIKRYTDAKWECWQFGNSILFQGPEYIKPKSDYPVVE